MNEKKKNQLLIRCSSIIGIVLIIFGVSAIVLCAIVTLPTWLKVLLIILFSFIVFVIIACLCLLDWLGSYYECPTCHKVFKPTFKQYLFTSHIGSKGKFYCLNCHEKLYFKRIFSKDEFALIEAGKGDPKKEYALLNSIEDENGFENTSFGISYEDYLNKVLPKFEKNSLGLSLQEGHVPQTTFFFYVNDVAIGIYKVRHYCNEVTRTNGAGHIGYGIRKESRGNGYAPIGLKMAIEELKKMPDFDKSEGIIMGCHKNNVASLKTQQRNGAVIIDETEIDYITKITL